MTAIVHSSPRRAVGFRLYGAVAISLALFTLAGFAQPVPKQWLTDYELSGYKRTPRYAETMAYARRLEKASPWIHVESFGRSPEGRDLPLIIASKERAFTPRSAMKSGKAIVLIQNGIHAGEIDGKDACLMLLRDIAVTKSKAALLDHVILLIIPIYRAGETLFLREHVPLSIPLIFERFRADFRQFLLDFGLIAIHGIVVWCLLAPIAALLIYYATRPALRALARRTAG